MIASMSGLWIMCYYGYREYSTSNMQFTHSQDILCASVVEILME